jgi:hypothetical protein
MAIKPLIENVFLQRPETEKPQGISLSAQSEIQCFRDIRKATYEDATIPVNTNICREI